MNVLLVEDELITRMGLRKAIEKDEKINVVAECSNGKQALEQVAIYSNIDVILLDLNMPIMNGLEFLDHLDSSFSGQVIVLSSYDDLDSIKEAMKKGASDYFHKPTMSPKKIISILKEADKRKKYKDNPTNEEWLNQLIYHPNHQLVDKINHWITSKQTVKEVIMVAADDITDQHILNYDMKQLLEKWLSTQSIKGDIIFFNDGKFLMIVELSHSSILNQFNYIHHLCHSLGNYFNETKQLSVSFGVSQSTHNPMQLKDCAEEANEALELRFFQGRGSVHFYYKNNVKTAEHYPETNYIWESFDHMKLDLLSATLNDYFEKLEKTHDRDFIITLIIGLKMELKRRMEKYTEFPQSKNVSAKSVVHLQFFSDVKKDVIVEFETMIKWLLKFENKQYSPMVRYILQYLQVNFQKDLSLNFLAKLVQTNPSYLSRIFKEQTGHKISEYITELRIEKAKKLLSEQNLRSKDVALAVGYTNERYFSQIFKRYTNTTPSAYKKQM